MQPGLSIQDQIKQLAYACWMLLAAAIGIGAITTLLEWQLTATGGYPGQTVFNQTPSKLGLAVTGVLYLLIALALGWLVITVGE